MGRKSIKKITDVPNEKFSNEKICKKRLAFFYTDDIIVLALQIQAPLAQLVEQ